jgi:hypothetical protein
LRYTILNLQVSSVAPVTNDDEVQISSESEDNEVEAEQQTNETPSGEDSSHGVNKRKRTSEI